MKGDLKIWSPFQILCKNFNDENQRNQPKVCIWNSKLINLVSILNEVLDEV